ncbi:alpha/beta fold hydrolase [Sneathiella glossodoripedis]|uniref:alpha/beta fold hydrolase n=1 Tax=Sneathiella glossodoripedis TaxID=418853 RepID=UPI000470746C|nr:alpha/beta hydrolase [Sneathiella glossodoripedis]
MNSGFADLGTHEIFYKIRGSGPRIVMITGTNSDTRHSPTIYDVPGIEKFEVLNFDHRGMGQSSSPAQDPTLQDYADDIAKLLEIIDWQNAIVIGVSFGGMVAQHFALRHQEKVEKLILCCTSSGGAGGSSFPLHELIDYSPEEYARFIMKKMHLQHTDDWQKQNPVKARQMYEFYLRGAEAAHSTTAKKTAQKKQFLARAKHDVFNQLNELKIPTLVACGIHDGVAPVENSEALAAAIPNSQLHKFRGGHLFLREDPKSWPTLLKFMKDES